MKDLESLLDLRFWGNSVRDYGWALLLFAVSWLALFVFKKLVLRILMKIAKGTARSVDNFIVEELSKFKPPFYFAISLFFASRSLNLSHRVDNLLLYFLLIALTVRLARTTQATVGFLFERTLLGAGEDRKAELSSLRTFNWLVDGIIWLVAGLFIISNMGVNITSLVAGMGIGGIAIALAAQSILGDLFSSLSILLDKPFRVGDAITVGEVSGVVEQIGVKTSRIRSITGEQIVIGNSDLTSSRVRNMQRMQERRTSYRFGIRYDTPPDLARAVPDLAREIIAKHPEVRFDRAHFVAFGDFALVYEVAYFVLSADPQIYMNAQQKINFEIMDAFAARQIRFAYPTQTIKVEGIHRGDAENAEG